MKVKSFPTRFDNAWITTGIPNHRVCIRVRVRVRLRVGLRVEDRVRYVIKYKNNKILKKIEEEGIIC